MCILMVSDGSHHRSSVCRLLNVSANSAHIETGERVETMLGPGGGITHHNGEHSTFQRAHNLLP